MSEKNAQVELHMTKKKCNNSERRRKTRDAEIKRKTTRGGRASTGCALSPRRMTAE
jgi:hypothetical protein